MFPVLDNGMLVELSCFPCISHCHYTPWEGVEGGIGEGKDFGAVDSPG